MLKRYLRAAGSVCLMLLLASPAVAQTPRPLTALFKRAAPVPAKVLRLEGPAQVEAGRAGIFTALANIETASLPFRGRWDFGDGTTATGLHARHTYAEPGTYTVLFTLSNAHGEDTDSLTVTVVPPEPPPLRQAVSSPATAPDRLEAMPAARLREQR